MMTVLIIYMKSVLYFDVNSEFFVRQEDVIMKETVGIYYKTLIASVNYITYF